MRSSGSTFLLAAAGISTLLLAGWVAWIAPQPDCGPAGTTALAHADRWVPWVFIATQAALPSLIGLWFRQPVSRIIVIVLSTGSVAFVLGAASDFGIALQANCFA